MPDTESRPALSRKLGGIPQGEAATAGIYRKPPAFKMKPIPRPSAAPERAPSSARGPKFLALFFLLLALSGGAYVYDQKRPQFVALWARWTAPAPAPAPAGGAVAPVDSMPLADASPGWTWLFDENEWRRPGDRDRYYRDGLVRLRARMEKPQPAADAVIRARVFIREGANSAGVFLRSTAENGRYRLLMDADARHVRLVHQGATGMSELGKYRFVKAREPGDQVLLELRAESDRLTASVNGAVVIEAQDTRCKEAGNWGIEAGDAWFGLVEVPEPRPGKLVAVLPAAEPEPPPVLLAPVLPAPVLPAATPAPAPAIPPAPLSETGKWLAGLEPQWQASFEREVLGPFEKSGDDLKKQYLSGLDSQLAFATQARKLDDAAAFRGERQRVGGGENVPAVDEAIVPPALKQLRIRYRSDFARLDQERYERARAFHARIDALVAQNQAALAKNQRYQEADELKIRRGQLAALWVKPPAAPPVVAATAAPSPTPVPAAPSFAKMPPRQVVEKLLAIGAGVWVDQKGNSRSEIKALTDLAGDRFDITRVEFLRAGDDKPLTTADLAVVEALSDVVELGLHGPAVTDAILEKLRPFRSLDRLTLDGAGITAAGYATLPTLTGLRELHLRRGGASDDAMKIIGQCRKLQRLFLVDLPIGDAGLAAIGKLPALEELGLNGITKLTSVGIGHLAEATTLRRLNLDGLGLSSPVLDAVARCHSLEYLNLSGNPLKDAQIAGLSGLTRLRGLNLNNTGIVGTGFAGWPPRTSLTSLNLSGEPGVNDAALKAIGSAFPKLETLEIEGVPLGATAAGFASVGRLRSLRVLRVGGGVVNDEIMAEIAKCDEITNLDIPQARLSEPGVVALTKLARLRTLHLEQPPVSDAALKSLAKCKLLGVIQIAADAPPETENKLRAALPVVTIRK